MIMRDSVEERLQEVLAKKYGSAPAVATVTTEYHCDKNEEGDSKPAPITCPTLVGSLKSDKTSIVADESDLLFDVDKDEVSP